MTFLEKFNYFLLYYEDLLLQYEPNTVEYDVVESLVNYCRTKVEIYKRINIEIPEDIIYRHVRIIEVLSDKEVEEEKREMEYVRNYLQK